MLYTQEHSIINGRNVWHYLLDTPLGHIHVVEYERPTQELERYIFDGDNDKAEKKYASICKAILSGKR